MITNKERRLNELWEELLGQKPTNVDLRYIIEVVKPLREKAKKLLKRSPMDIIKEMISLLGD